MAEVTPERIDAARDAARRLLNLTRRLPAELRGLQEASIPADEKDAALVAKFYGLQPAITEAQAAMPSDILDCVMLAAGPGDYIIDGRFHEGTAHAATEILARRKLFALARAAIALRLSLTEPLPQGSGYVDPPGTMRHLLESGFGHAAVLLMLRSESEQVREGFWKAAIADVDAVAVPTQLWAAVDKEWAAARRAIAADALAAGGGGHGQDAAPAGDTQPEKPKAGKLAPKMPPEKARQAYWTRLAVGDNQTTIARKMTENGVPANQGQVSRWLRAVDAFLTAGGIMPPLQRMHEQPQAMDPGTLDMGERQDGRTPRQRGKMVDPADDWD